MHNQFKKESVRVRRYVELFWILRVEDVVKYRLSCHFVYEKRRNVVRLDQVHQTNINRRRGRVIQNEDKSVREALHYQNVQTLHFNRQIEKIIGAPNPGHISVLDVHSREHVFGCDHVNYQLGLLGLAVQKVIFNSVIVIDVVQLRDRLVLEFYFHKQNVQIAHYDHQIKVFQKVQVHVHVQRFERVHILVDCLFEVGGFGDFHQSDRLMPLF